MRSSLTRHRFRLLVLLLALPAVAAAQVAPRDSAYLVGTTQRLLDAITSGDSAVWSPRLAPGWFLSDEEGAQIPRAEFLAGLHPLPAGQQGSLAVSHPHFASQPGVIVMSYDADETHDYYGQRLITTFHSTDTWVKRGGRWQQLAEHTTALPRVIEGVRVDSALGAEYAGRYRLAPEIELEIVVSDSGLASVRTGHPAVRLYALDDRLFVRHGVRGFWVFERDSTGAVARLVNWRDNNPVVWVRTR